MRSAWLLVALIGCNRAPAPCADHTDCPAAQCINGACVVQTLVPDAAPQPDGEPAPEPEPRDMGEPRDAVISMDAAPGCEHLGLTVTLPEDAGPLRRNEPIRLSVTVAAGAMVTYESSAGGAFVEEPGGAQWIARDEVAWPWETGPIDLTVRASLDDCRVSQSVRVTLIGDLMLGDGVSGQLDIVGSNGTLFGQWRLVDPSGVSALTRLPDGGYLVGVRGPSQNGTHDAPEIVRLDANGQEVSRFATTSVVDASPLFTRPVVDLHVDGGEVVAVSNHDAAVHWFSLDGQHLRTVETDGARTVAVAPWREAVLIALNGERRLRVPGEGMLQVVGEAEDPVEGLYPLLDGAVLVVGSRSEDVVERLEVDGRITPAPAPPIGWSISGLTPFDDGYLALSDINNRLLELGADLQAADPPDLAGLGAGNPRGILWLNRP